MADLVRIDASAHAFSHENGNAPVPFGTLMGITCIKSPPDAVLAASKSGYRNSYWIFRSLYPAYSPGGFTRAFGGHVYAQACVAASHTVPKGFLIHNMTGHFLLLGLTNIPFIYHVKVIRNGRGFVQRIVEVTQEADAGPVFTATLSFKRAEANVQDRSQEARLEERFPEALEGKRIEDHGVAPGVDSPFWWDMEKETGPDPFPGLIMHKVNMDAHNKSLKTLDRKQLQFYKVIPPIIGVDDDANLHAAAHLFASDRNGLFPVPNFLEMGNSYSNIATLSHTVIFHGDAASMNLLDAQGKAKDFCIEGILEHISHGRALVNTKLWDVSTGRPVASTFQDGLVRMQPGVVQSMDGEGSLFKLTPGMGKSVKL